jgi:nucleotide-binding universal stress UspA family protein
MPDRKHTPEIVLATDFSPDADAAADAARRYAHALGARVHVLHVSSLGATEAIVAALEAASARLDGLRVVLVVEKGPAAARILAYATEVGADLIVVGAHGQHAVPTGPLGIVAETVTRRAGCPVLTVRAEAVGARPSMQALRA